MQARISTRSLHLDFAALHPTLYTLNPEPKTRALELQPDDCASWTVLGAWHVGVSEVRTLYIYAV